MTEPSLTVGESEVRERLGSHKSRTELFGIELDLRNKRAVLVPGFSELVVRDLCDIEHYYNLLHYPVHQREITSTYIWLERS